MRVRNWVLAMAFVSALHQNAQAADGPAELIVGQWKLRQPIGGLPPKLNETFEFSADGKGKVSKAGAEKTETSATSWAITATYGNACIIKITNDNAPKEVSTLVLLLVFDGSDTAIFQARPDRITYMDRQKTP